MKLVFYQHSAVNREIMPNILEQMGAEVALVGFSKTFVPVDTEAVDEPERLADWVREHTADALVSADGDADRPLVVDEQGKVVRGDVLGILVSRFLGVDSVSVPVSCNSALERSGRFANVSRTRIGSPYVIESMNEAIGAGYQTVVGYEANGGFLTGTDITNTDTGAVLPALPTRDAALPVIAVLLASLRRGGTLSDLVSELPPIFTASGLLRGFPNESGKALVEKFRKEGTEFATATFSADFGAVDSIDFTDGARITFQSGDIVHLRPSGNAPEFRCYTESSSEDQAIHNNDIALKIVAELKGKIV
jgi:phosphomannomutase